MRNRRQFAWRAIPWVLTIGTMILVLAVAIGARASQPSGSSASAFIDSSQPSSYGGWTPTPTVAYPGELLAAKRSCNPVIINDLREISNVPSKVSSQIRLNIPSFSIPKLSASRWQVIGADIRGPIVLLNYVYSSESVTGEIQCLARTGRKSRIGEVLGNEPTISCCGDDFGQIFVQLSANGLSVAVGPISYLIQGGTNLGRVDRVSLVLSDGTHVTATVANGFYLAWWPGKENLIRATISLPQGTQSVTTG